MSLADPQRILSHLREIIRPRDAFQNPENLKRVQDYISAQFKSYGLQVEEHPFQAEGRTFSNLLARKEGESGQARFIVGAHFDAVPGTPGADDNASGVACMLEAARLFCEKFPAAGVQFAAFNLEEYGMLGSTAYAKFLKSKMTPEEKRNFKGMISLEMVGFTSKEKGSQHMPEILKPYYPDTGDFLALVGDTDSKELQSLAWESYVQAGLPAHGLTVPVKGTEFPEVRLSDHSAFWDEDFPALLVTDTSFFRNPHYHKESDTLETLDLDFMTKAAEGTFNLIEEIGRSLSS